MKKWAMDGCSSLPCKSCCVPGFGDSLDQNGKRRSTIHRQGTGQGQAGGPTRLPVWGQVPISPLCRRPGSRAWQSRGLPAATTMPKADGGRTHKGRSLHAARIEMMSSGDWIHAEYRRVLRATLRRLQPSPPATGHRASAPSASHTATSSAPLQRGHDLPARHNAPIVGSSRCSPAGAIKSVCRRRWPEKDP